VEALALVIVTAIAVPPLVRVATAGSAAVADDRSAVRAAWLASAVVEQVVADAASGEPGLGLEAMGDAAYLDDPADGLYARLQPTSAVYAARGMTCEVTIGPAVDASGAAVDAADPEATRLVTVEVIYTDARGVERRAPVRTVAGRP